MSEVSICVCMYLTHNEQSGNFCHTCGCEFLDKKRKKNIIGKFAKIFEAVFNENVSENDALPRAVCDPANAKLKRHDDSLNKPKNTCQC